MELLLYKNDMLLELTGLKNELTEAFVNNATVTATLKTRAGVAVSGQTWPLTLVYKTASDGIYQGILDAALVVSVGDHLKAEVTIVAAGGIDGFFSTPVKVVDRE